MSEQSFPFPIANEVIDGRVPIDIMKFQPFILTFLIAIVVASSVDARPRNIDLRKRSSLLGKKVEMNIVRFDKNKSMGNRRFDIKEWHKQYSSLGNKKSHVTVSGESNEKKLKRFERFEKQDADVQLTSNERKMANLKNWNQLREVVKASKYSKDAITSPVGRQFNEMVDEITLGEINRFQTVRNDDRSNREIPVEPLSGTKAPSTDSTAK